MTGFEQVIYARRRGLIDKSYCGWLLETYSNNTHEGWVAPALTAAAIIGAGGLVAADRGKFGEPAKEFVQPVTRPIKKVFNWDKGKATNMKFNRSSNDNGVVKDNEES
jgi:hypothetical protein